MNILIYVLFSLLLHGLLVISIFTNYMNNYLYAQPTTTSNNITDLLFEKYYQIVKVDYESDSMIVLEGNKNYISQINGSVVPFWESIDIVKNQGYSLKEIITLGTGTNDNPTIFYAIFINNSSKIEK